jgi:hypothetical protein
MWNAIKVNKEKILLGDRYIFFFGEYYPFSPG